MRGPARLVVQVTRGMARAELVRGGQVVWAAEAGFADADALADVIAALGAELGAEPTIAGRVRTAHVELLPPLVQLRTLADLPPVRGHALPALVANQASRFFRTTGTPLVTNAAWERRGRTGPRTARAAAVEEPWVEAIVRGLQAAGLAVDAITPVTSSLLLLPTAERATRARKGRLRVARLAALAALLWVLAGALGLWRLRRETAEVDRELARLQPAVTAMRAARREYEAALAMLGALDESERRRGTVTAATLAVLLALPESAYVRSLQMSPSATGRTGELVGGARHATDLMRAVAQQTQVPGARLAGPPAREVVAGLDYERITIHFGTDSTP